MNFKNFISESFDSKATEIGDILSSLETVQDNIDNIKRKNLIDILNQIVSNIIPFLKSKNDKNLLLILQKIAFAIKNDIDENNDFRETIESSIYELKKYFEKNSTLLNTPIKKDEPDGISSPVEQKPEYVKINKNVENLSGDEASDSTYSPPLGGSGEKTFNNI